MRQQEPDRQRSGRGADMKIHTTIHTKTDIKTETDIATNAPTDAATHIPIKIDTGQGRGAGEEL